MVQRHQYDHLVKTVLLTRLLPKTARFTITYGLTLQVFVEYVMLAHVNDSEEQAQQLGSLLQGRAVVLNLIPWNPVYSPEFDFKAPGHQRTDAFQKIVRQYGVHCTVRQEKGQDISGT